MTDNAFERGDFAPAEPTFDTVAIEATEVSIPNGFEKLGLAPELMRAIADLGFTQPTPVQEATIPMAQVSQDAAGFNDLMVSSQTGSGKTAAFLLPVLHTIIGLTANTSAPHPARARSRKFEPAAPQALVLCPTRELAQQVGQDAIDLVRHTRGVRIANVVGGMPYQLQIARLANANLVVATPGRLLDLQRSGQIRLDQVQFLVVDEADRMLDLGFADDLAEINKLTIERRQTMMFSATFAARIQQLAARVMRQPKRVQIDSPQERHVNIKQVLFWAD